MQSIDLNCDLGEGMPDDELLMCLISSANIACGGHAGDEDSMKLTVNLALQHKVAIGAHPSYPDKKNFGRFDLLGAGITAADLVNITGDQLESLQKICLEEGASLHHVKPHGALYNRLARDEEAAGFFCEAVRDFNSSLLIYGLSGSRMEKIATDAGLTFIHEVFADRTYREDGSLTPRSEPGALIEEPDACLFQLTDMLERKSVRSTTGNRIPVRADTVCLHGDGTHAVEFATLICKMLAEKNISVKTC
jgi:UPF0271 protein